MGNNVEIIKAIKNDKVIRGKKIDVLKVAAYCRVSTDTEDQLNSYKSQVDYYTNLIRQNPEWELADIYADEAVTGTMVSKRENFQRMINDCMSGHINMVITKSISRFARNTMDTLQYVRMLKERNVAVLFEDEKINTMSMDGELMLVILSSVAQQEVENISANVKKGLKMKMSRGEFVGFSGCLGYDWIPETKSIVVNKDEAKIVKYIFDRYVSGIGCDTIAKELEARGYKTKRGQAKWCGSTVMGIVTNEKYVGDVLFGKTFTADPIKKRRLKNYGEEDKFYIKDHHEPIIDREVFEIADEIRRRRNVNLGVHKEGDIRKHRYTRQYNFSSMLRCGFCGNILTRRRWHARKDHEKIVWQCSTAAKKGKSYCSCSKAIHEEIVENAFIKSYQLLYSKDKNLMDEFLENAKVVLSEGDEEETVNKARDNLLKLKNKKDNLLNLKLNGLIDDETFSNKNFDLSQKISSIEKTLEHLNMKEEQRGKIEKRIIKFKKALEQGEIIEEFSREVFESVIDYVVIGGYDDQGEEQPDMVTFVFKTGRKTKMDSMKFKRQHGRMAACYIDMDEQPFKGYMEIFSFEEFSPHRVFKKKDDNIGLEKELKHTVNVSVGVVA